MSVAGKPSRRPPPSGFVRVFMPHGMPVAVNQPEPLLGMGLAVDSKENHWLKKI